MTTRTPRADLIADWLEVRAMGYLTYSAAAERLGMKASTLEKAVRRAQADGDKRVPASLRDTQPPSYDQLHHSPTMDARVHLGDDERCRAARYVASRARDADDLAGLLGALGLTAEDARP